MKKIILILLGAALFNSGVMAHPPTSFSAAKRLTGELFSEHRETLYCQCRFDKYKSVNLESCGMESANSIKRAGRVEIEHMMPGENLGRHFPCWREKLCTDKRGKRFRGRKCCQKISPEFRKAEAELYNLWPSVGLINQLRSNYRYSPLERNQKTYGCDFKVNSKLRRAEPGDHAKGIVARANLFMSEKYHIRLSKQQRQLFEAWNKQFPPTLWEKEWANKVAEIEGYSNRYIN